ncbi:MAG: beta strand repeat-containing protein, partial [Pseudohongiellaceae bacterium]
TRKTLVASGAGAMVAFANPGDDDNGMAANCDILAADMSVVRAGYDECYFNDGSSEEDDGVWTVTAIQIEPEKMAATSDEVMVTLDTIGPTVTLDAPAMLAVGAATTITLSVGETVSGFAAADIRVVPVGGGALSDFALVAGSTDYTVTFTAGSAISAVSISIPAGSSSGGFTDSAGNYNASAEAVIMLMEAPPPTGPASAQPTIALGRGTDTGSSDSDRITNEGFPVFALGNLVANATIVVRAVDPNGLSITRKTLVASGTTATVTFADPGDDDSGVAASCDILDGDGRVVLRNFDECYFNDGSSEEDDGIWVITATQTEPGRANSPTDSAELRVTLDTIAPTITLATGGFAASASVAIATLAGGATTTITLTTSEAVVGFEQDDVSVIGGSLSGFAQVGASNNYTVTFTADFSSAAITARVYVAPGSSNVVVATDIAGNHNESSDLLLIAVEPVPIVTIAASTTSVTEADNANAVFVVTSDMMPTANLSVDVEVTQTGNYIADTDATTHTVTIMAADTTATLTIAIVNDDADEPNGTVTAMLVDRADYSLDTASSATVSVTDDDTPALSIAAATSTATEGTDANANYTITADIVPHAALMVALNVADESGRDFVESDNEGDKTVMLSFTASGSGTMATVTYQVPIDDDDVFEEDGVITVMLGLNAGQDYTLGTPVSAEVTVTSEDAEPVMPAVSITVSPSSGAEGSDAVFTVSALPVPNVGSDLTVPLTVVLPAAFTSTTTAAPPTEVTLTNAAASATFTVTTDDDDADEADAVITATLTDPITNAGYTLGTNPAMFSVTDNDGPNISVANASDGAEPTTPVVFTVTLSAAPVEDTEVTWMTADRTSGDNLALAGTDYTAVNGILTFAAAGSTITAMITVDVINDDDVEPDETFLLRLGNPTNDAKITEGEGEATGTITSEDVPSVSIAASSSSVMESNSANATFVVTSNAAPTASLAVDVAVTQTGDYIADVDATTHTVAIMAATTTATLTIAIVNDDADEPNGNVTAMVVDGADYDPGTASSATVSVVDDDDPAPVASAIPTITAPAANAFVNAANETAFTVAGTSGADAVLSIDVTGGGTYNSGNPTSVTADSGGGWTIALDLSGLTDNTNLTISVTASETGMLVSMPTRVTVMRDATAPTVTFGGDATVRVNNSINVTFTLSDTTTEFDLNDLTPIAGDLANFDGSGTDYNVDFTGNAINAAGGITVRENAFTDTAGNGNALMTRTINVSALPVISIAASNSSLAEAADTNAVFVVTSDMMPTANLSVDVAITQTGGYIAGADTATHTVTIMAAATTATLSIAIVNDDADEMDGSVTAMLVDGTDYDLGGASSATVNVADDDTPALSIAAANATATEGTDANANYTITADIVPHAALMVALNVADESGRDFVAGDDEGDKTAMLSFIATGSGTLATATYQVPIHDDDVFEEDGVITVMLKPNAGQDYSVGMPASAGVTVTSEDAEPVMPAVSITVSPSSGAEGSDAVFTVSALPVPNVGSDLTVPLMVVVPTTFTSSTAAAPPTMVTLTNAAANATFTVTTDDDDLDEADAVITATLTDPITNAGYMLGTDQAMFSVTDNDGPNISVASASDGAEPTTPVVFTVTLSDAPVEDTEVRWMTADRTSGSDIA